MSDKAVMLSTFAVLIIVLIAIAIFNISLAEKSMPNLNLEQKFYFVFRLGNTGASIRDIWKSVGIEDSHYIERLISYQWYCYFEWFFAVITMLPMSTILAN